MTPAEPEPAAESSPYPVKPGGGLSLLRRFGPLAVIAALAAAAFSLGLTDYLSLEALKAQRSALQALVAASPWTAAAVFIGVYIVIVGFSLPGALIMTLTGGLLFGPWLGGLASAVGASIGAALLFVVCRTAVGDSLRGRAGSAVARIEAGVRKDAFAYLLTLRLIPALPFWLVNLAAAFVDIPLRTFFLATLLGVLPGSLIYAGLGSGLGALFDQGAEPNLGIIFQPQILSPLVGLGLLSLLPVLVRAFRRDKPTPEAEAGR